MWNFVRIKNNSFSRTSSFLSYCTCTAHIYNLNRPPPVSTTIYYNSCYYYYGVPAPVPLSKLQLQLQLRRRTNHTRSTRHTYFSKSQFNDEIQRDRDDRDDRYDRDDRDDRDRGKRRIHTPIVRLRFDVHRRSRDTLAPCTHDPPRGFSYTRDKVPGHIGKGTPQFSRDC